jgi:hypothetical protein
MFPSINRIELFEDAFDQIQWMESYQGSLVVFTMKSIYVITGGDGAYSATRVDGSVGCRSGSIRH